MIAWLGKTLAGVGLSWLGNLVLDWDSRRQAATANAAQQAGANQQVIRDTADTAATMERIAQAEADSDRSQSAVEQAARTGHF